MINSANMSIQHQYPPQDVAWLRRDVLLFANSIGVSAERLHFLYVSSIVLAINSTVQNI